MSSTTVIKNYPILYKKDKSEKVRMWNISAVLHCNDNTYWIKTEYGQQDGKIILSEKVAGIESHRLLWAGKKAGARAASTATVNQMGQRNGGVNKHGYCFNRKMKRPAYLVAQY